MTPNATGGEPPEAVQPPADEPAAAWKRDRQGREYVAARGRKGIIFRKDGESVADALARDAQPAADKRPRQRSRPMPKPTPPKAIELKELEKLLADALASPTVLCAMFGDEWAADHFATQGPRLARNLVNSAEHNPWLRKKLEAMAAGGELPMKLVALIGVGGALATYAIPPVVWWLNLPVPNQARELFGIPPRREAEDVIPASPEVPANGAPVAQAA